MAYRLPKGPFVAVHLRRTSSRTVAHKRRRDIRMYGLSSTLSVKSPFGFVALLPAPAAGLNGGGEATKQLAASLEAFCAPLLSAGAPFPAPSLVHAAQAGAWEESLPLYGRGYGYGDASTTEASYLGTVEPKAGAAPGAPPVDKNAIVRFAAADWGGDDAACFDAAALVVPKAVDASAAADRAGALAALHAEWEEERAASRGAVVLRELKGVANVSWQHHYGAYDYVRQQRADGSWSKATPAARLALRLEPDGQGSRTGHLAVNMYIQSTTSEEEQIQGAAAHRHCRTLLCSGGDGRHATSCAPLHQTITTLLEASSPGHRANAAVWRELEFKHGKDPSVSSTQGLLAAVESQERGEAPQPPGLAVQLRPYQRQALGFMLEAENTRGAGHFWSELPLPPQHTPGGGAASASPAGDDEEAPPHPRALFFSPMLTRLTRDAPAVLEGGLLCEESACAPQPRVFYSASQGLKPSQWGSARRSSAWRSRLCVPLRACLDLSFAPFDSLPACALSCRPRR